MPKGNKTKKPNGRPRSEFSEEVLPLLEGVTGSGTVTRICEVLGISSTVFYKWLKDEPSFSEAVMRVRARADDQIEDAFFNRAKGYTINITEEKMDKDGMTVPLTRQLHHAADAGAALNFLKNRRPEVWRDTKTVELKGAHVDLVAEALADLGINTDDA